MGLSEHPRIIAAAETAIKEFGPHSAGSPTLLGNTRVSIALEKRIAETLDTEHVLLFPTGWAAGFGIIVGLVRHYDHIILDQLSHACLQQGVHAATANVVPTQHLCAEDVRRNLSSIRAKDTKNSILVVTEGLFSMDSDSPDLVKMQEYCHEYNAVLLVDIAHDFGSTGPNGTGQIGIQDLLGKIDLVMGSFSKTFASNGGFLATNSNGVRETVKYYGGPHIFSNAISPVQAAIVLEALEIARSEEGDRLRSDLLTVVKTLRKEFFRQGIECMGDPSAIVPVPVGSEAVARVSSALLFARKVLANLVEFPAVPVRAARYRMQVMATHKPEQAKTAARIVAESIIDARAMVDAMNSN